jgi:hypothetical protein
MFCLLYLYVVLSCDELITRPEESYRVSVCVRSRNPEKGGQRSILDYKRLWMNESPRFTSRSGVTPISIVSFYLNFSYYAYINISYRLSNPQISKRNVTQFRENLFIYVSFNDAISNSKRSVEWRNE